MTSGSWPYFPGQCPRCSYYEAFEPPRLDDGGYETLGFCRHPQIAMELFRARRVRTPDAERCPLFAPRQPES